MIPYHIDVSFGEACAYAYHFGAVIDQPVRFLSLCQVKCRVGSLEDVATSVKCMKVHLLLRTSRSVRSDSG